MKHLKQPLLPLYHLINPCDILPYILDILASVNAVCTTRFWSSSLNNKNHIFNIITGNMEPDEGMSRM